MGARGYVALIAAAVVVLVVLPLTMTMPLLWEDGPVPVSDPPATGDPSPGESGVALAIGCSDAAAPATEVSTDVVAARMCATDNGLLRWYAPQDTLDGDLGLLLHLLSTLQPVPRSTDEQRYYCPDDGGYGFDLRLMRASGEVVSIPGDTGGCSTVRIGGADLGGSDGVLKAFLDAIARQRRTTEPAAALDALRLACGSDGPFGDHVVSRIGDPRDIVTAVSCWRPDSGDDVGPWRGPTPVPEALLAALVADMREHTRRDLGWDAEPCRDRPVTWQDLVGRTRWGDVVVVRGVCSTYLLSDVSSVAPDDQEFWYPSPRAQRILYRLRW